MRGFRVDRYPPRIPTEKSIRLHFENPEIDPKEVRKVFKTSLEELYQYKSVIEYRKGCYHEPTMGDMRRVAMNEVIQGHGVEACCSKGGKFAEYINMGDIYNATVVWYHGMCYFTTLGGFLEGRKEFE